MAKKVWVKPHMGTFHYIASRKVKGSNVRVRTGGKVTRHEMVCGHYRTLH